MRTFLKKLPGADFREEDSKALSFLGRASKRIPQLGGGGADPAPLQVVAHGTVVVAAGAIVAASTFTDGCVAARTGAGVFTLTLDASLVGQVVANSLRCLTQSLTALNVTTVAKTSTTVITVTSEVATTGVATDGNFDFVIYRTPGL